MAPVAVAGTIGEAEDHMRRLHLGRRRYLAICIVVATCWLLSLPVVWLADDCLDRTAAATTTTTTAMRLAEPPIGWTINIK